MLRSPLPNLLNFLTKESLDRSGVTEGGEACTGLDSPGLLEDAVSGSPSDKSGGSDSTSDKSGVWSVSVFRNVRCDRVGVKSSTSSPSRNPTLELVDVVAGLVADRFKRSRSGVLGSSEF